METVKRSGVTQDWGEKGLIGRAQRIFRAVKLFCVTLQWWIHVAAFVKTIECTTQRVTPNVNNEFIIMYQILPINCNKCAPLMQDVITRGNCGVGSLRGVCGIL